MEHTLACVLDICSGRIKRKKAEEVAQSSENNYICRKLVLEKKR